VKNNSGRLATFLEGDLLKHKKNKETLVTERNRAFFNIIALA